MKRGTPMHPKVDSLMRRLGIRRSQAVGLLEMLWHATAQYAPKGDIGKLDNQQIADRVDWDGDADKLVESLVVIHWIDKDLRHRLVIHDWHIHADGSVRKTLQRSGESFIVADNGGRCPDNGETWSTNESGLPCQALPGPALPCQALPKTTPDKTSDSEKSGRKRKPRATTIDPPVPAPLASMRFLAAWGDWLAMRTEKGRPATPTAAKRQLARLEALGEERATAAVEHSTGNGWDGIFEPDGRKHGQRNDGTSGRIKGFGQHESGQVKADLDGLKVY